MKLSKDTDSDREALVAKQGSNEGSNEDESSYNYARDYLDDNDEETAGFGRHGLQKNSTCPIISKGLFPL